MKIYIELYDDFKHTIEYVEELSKQKLDDDELRMALIRMAATHQIILSESEIQIFISNLKKEMQSKHDYPT